MTLLRPSEAAELLDGVDPHYAQAVLRRAADDGKVRTARTVGGHRRYDEASVRAWLGLDESDEPDDAFVGRREACRVLGVAPEAANGAFGVALAIIAAAGLVATDDRDRCCVDDLRAVATALREDRRLPLSDSPTVAKALDTLREAIR